jgi:hypothetical protein
MAIFIRGALVGLVALSACSTRVTSIGDESGPDMSVSQVTPPDLLGRFVDPTLSDLLGALAIAPLQSTVTVSSAPVPTVQFTATTGSITVQPNWSVDRGEIAGIDANGLVTPTGTTAGVVTITARYGSQMATTTLTVVIDTVQSGDPAATADLGTPDGGASSGGYAGVGGNGPGNAATPTQQTVLNGTPTSDSTVRMLYPYDQTVWPRGLLAPLLQWDPGAHAFDSVYVHITETNYDYKGYFSAPSGGAAFVNLPIPQAVWQDATYSNAGDNMVVTLTFAQGGSAYGPYTLNWKIVPAVLGGTVYYNSYGTALAKNYGTFGGATLSIKAGQTGPALVAGTNAATTGCRVCHSVAANGSTLLTQHGDNYAVGSDYNLQTSPPTETQVGSPDMGTYNTAFASLTPDGTMALTNVGASTIGDSTSHLLSMPSGTPLAATGLVTNFSAGSPAFSPDGKHIAFNFYGGTGSDKRSLAVMGFDSGSLAFSNLTTLATPVSTSQRTVWPAFMPTNDSIVYEVEVAETGEFGMTRKGVRGELWWVDLTTKTPARLDRLNGWNLVPDQDGGTDDGGTGTLESYLPTVTNPTTVACHPDGSATDFGAVDPTHALDTTYNYEPTINPIVSGGYAWVVFTSRRAYGNVAAIAPFCSDPRALDLTTYTTTKKLWVAAIDLNAPPGTDPSHPAFYLPGQELKAGNSRGYWSVDPCHADGASCLAGNECCGGYCQQGANGALVCNSTTPTCSQVNDHCNTTADCCGADDGIACINNFCGVANPPVQ